MEPTMANGLTMRWIPVSDASGRTRLEAVWISEADSVAAPATAPTAA